MWGDRAACRHAVRAVDMRCYGRVGRYDVNSVISLEVPVKNLVLDIVRVCGSATSLPEDHPERDVLLQIQAFTRDLDVQLGVSPQLESCVAPSLAMS